MKKWVISIVVVALLAVGTLWGRGYINPIVAQPKEASTAAPTVPPATLGDQITAEGVVIPVRQVALSVATAGIVTDVPTAEGDLVEAGQLLVQLDGQPLQAALAEAIANQKMAEAGLAKLQAGAPSEDVAVAQAAVDVARTQVTSAEAAVNSALTNLARIKRGPTKEDVAIAERRIEVAKNALWGAQGQRDAICGRKSSGGSAGDCDAAKAAMQQGEEEVHIAELQLQQIKSPARREDVAAAQSQVDEAEGRLATAQAGVRQAEAQLARTKKATAAEDIAIAQAQVDQAKAAVERAQATLANAQLRAPFAGTLVALEAKAGECAAPGKPIAQVADLSVWQVETTDLTELNVLRLREGDPVVMRFDAIDGLELRGRIVRIKTLGEDRHGDITFTVIIAPDEQDPRLRWNMTASVEIRPQL